MGVKVTGLLGHFLDNGFYKVFSYKLKLCKVTEQNSETQSVSVVLIAKTT